MTNRKTLTHIGFFVVLLLVVAALFSHFSKSSSADEYSFTQFMADAKEGKVASVTLPQAGGGLTEVRLKSGKKVQVIAPHDLWLVSELREYKINVDVRPIEGPSMLWQVFGILGPAVLIIGFYYWMMKSSGMTGRSGSGMFGVTNNPAKESSPDKSTIRFADVAGCDEAKAEVTELVDFLKEPSRFQAVGGKIPKGVLLVGQPGTGKTMMAKAIAGEAGVPFFSVSGSDFVQMFVGVGAARVRSMFEEARKKAPCIIYIDEIDSVGRQRSAGGGFGGNDEREQTLNQILVEMDGFGGDTNVIVLASTNRVDILDSALLRPGRFDRQVVVPAPDVKGREQILTVHTAKIPLGPDVRLDLVAKTTPGYVGADLANLVNEAAMMAGRERARLVTQRHFELAADKIVMGPERRSMKMSEEERRTTAYHEAGHAAVGIVRGNDPVHKVSIVPRGRALGITMQLPQEDRYCLSKDHWLAELEVLMGGRAAEEVFCKKITTGASNDMMRATAIARRMVTEWGMSELLGPLHYGDNEGRGRSTFGPEIQKLIDSEVRNLVDAAYQNAVGLMNQYREAIEKMTALLLDKETIDSADVESCFPADIQQRANKQWKRNDVTDIIPTAPNDVTSSSGDPVIVM